MNYEIDLRSPECRNHNKIIKPKTMKIMLYMLSFALMIAFCYALDIYELKLQAETEMLKAKVAAKTEAAAPLIAMSAELETYQRRSDIVETLLGGYLIITDDLKALEKTASPGLRISYLKINAEGKIEIRGSGSTLQSAALFARKMQDLPFISKAELTAADLNEESSCFFSISADLKQAAGGDEVDQ